MKKIFFGILVCIIVSALCMYASAEASQLVPDENGTFSVEYTGQPGEHYFMIVLDGMYYEGEERTLTDDSILYLAQEKADENGVVSFSEFCPKPCDVATVFISGEGIATPMVYGYINTVGESAINVPANSTVHFADGTTHKYTDKTTIFAPAEQGFMYVNTDYASHSLYFVNANGEAQHLDCFDNTVVGINGASIRTQAPQGLRFYSYASNSSKEVDASDYGYEIAEYGFIVTAETAQTGLINTNYVLDMNLVSKGKAVSGVAYKKDKMDKVFENQDDYNRSIFTAVLLNIPENKVGYTTTIAYRPYYIITDGENETVIYGDITTRRICDVAVAIKVAAGDDYINNKNYIDSIIETAEITLDASDLYNK